MNDEDGGNLRASRRNVDIPPEPPHFPIEEKAATRVTRQANCGRPGIVCTLGVNVIRSDPEGINDSSK